MPFSFPVYELASYSDPDTIFGGSENTTSGEIGSTFTLNPDADFVTVTTEFGPDDGGEDLTEPVTLGGTPYPVGVNVEAEYEVIFVDETTGLYYRVTGLQVDGDWVGVTISQPWNATTGAYEQANPPLGITLTAIDGDDLDETPNVEQFTTDNRYSGILGNDAQALGSVPGTPCFATGSLVEMADGRTMPVERLQVGDLVRTADGADAKVKWIGAKRLSASDLRDHPNLRPIRVRAGALGDNQPSADLVLSPQHRLLVRSKIVERMTSEKEALVAVKHLLEVDGIDIVDDMEGVTYHHFACDRHEVIYVNGATTETFLTGPQGLKTLEPAARSELLTLFPEFAAMGSRPDARRLLLSGKRGRRLAHRHVKNKTPLVCLAI